MPGPNYLVSNVAGGGILSLRNPVFRGTPPANSSNAQTYLFRLNGPVKLTEVQGVTLVHADLNSSVDASTAARVAALGKQIQ